MVLFAGKTVWSTPERFAGFTTRYYINPRFIQTTFYNSHRTWEEKNGNSKWMWTDSTVTLSLPSKRTGNCSREKKGKSKCIYVSDVNNTKFLRPRPRPEQQDQNQDQSLQDQDQDQDQNNKTKTKTKAYKTKIKTKTRTTRPRPKLTRPRSRPRSEWQDQDQDQDRAFTQRLFVQYTYCPSLFVRL